MLGLSPIMALPLLGVPSAAGPQPSSSAHRPHVGNDDGIVTSGNFIGQQQGISD